MFSYRNPIEIRHTYMLKKGLLDGLNFLLRINSKELEQTQLFKEVSGDENILKALEIQAARYEAEDIEALCYTIAKNFAIDLMEKVGVTGRRNANAIIKKFEEKELSEATSKWREKVELAEQEFNMARKAILANHDPRFRRLEDYFKAVEMLVFRGLSQQQVMEILKVNNKNLLEQWKHRGIDVILKRGCSSILREVLEHSRVGKHRPRGDFPPLPAHLAPNPDSFPPLSYANRWFKIGEYTKESKSKHQHTCEEITGEHFSRGGDDSIEEQCDAKATDVLVSQLAGDPPSYLRVTYYCKKHAKQRKDHQNKVGFVGKRRLLPGEKIKRKMRKHRSRRRSRHKK